MSLLTGDVTTILAFKIDEEYRFVHYFDDRTLFDELSEYYNDDRYRFEVPPEEYETVGEILDRFNYELEVVEKKKFERYCVVKERHTPHEEILRRSVEHWTRDGYHFFLMQDRRTVSAAVVEGATPLDQTGFVLGKIDEWI